MCHLLFSGNKGIGGNAGGSGGGAGGRRREIESKDQMSLVIGVKSSKKRKVVLKPKENMI